MSGGGPPTLLQYLLNPWEAHNVLGPESLNDPLCREFRVPFPDRTYPNSGGSEFVEMPPYPLVQRIMPGCGQPTLPQ